MDVAVLWILEESVEVASSVRHEQISERFSEQVVEIPAPQVAEQSSKRFVFEQVAQATAQTEAEAVTQEDETAVALNKARCANARSREGLNRIDKNRAVGNGVDGPPKASATRVDALGQTPEEDRAKIASFVGMECNRDYAESLDVYSNGCRTQKKRRTPDKWYQTD